MLSIIALRNLIELSGSTFSLLPTSFIPVMPSMTIMQSIFSPALIVILSEMLVDWLKHAFITKFNHSEWKSRTSRSVPALNEYQVRPAVYGRFIDVLCRDLVSGGPSSDSTVCSRSDRLSFFTEIVSECSGFRRPVTGACATPRFRIITSRLSCRTSPLPDNRNISRYVACR